MITGLYAALFAFLQILLILKIVKVRRRDLVSLGLGEDNDELTRKSRAHGNFVETVPMAIMLMLIAELGGAPLYLIHILGLAMLISRVLHFYGLTTGKGYGPLRFYGMILTLSVYICGGLICLWFAVFTV